MKKYPVKYGFVKINGTSEENISATYIKSEL